MRLPSALLLRIVMTAMSCPVKLFEPVGRSSPLNAFSAWRRLVDEEKSTFGFGDNMLQRQVRAIYRAVLEPSVDGSRDCAGVHELVDRNTQHQHHNANMPKQQRSVRQKLRKT